MLVDPDFLPLLEEVADQVPGLRHVVVLDSSVPDTSLPGVIAYEDLIADQPTEYDPLDIPERTPLGLCYTSGTTGRPKGAEYTHRSTYLHAFGVTSAASMAIGPGDSVLAQVPMFHANAWGMPYGACLAGAKQVYFAGPLDPVAFVDLLVAERVTISAGVPTVWLTVADEIATRGGLPDMRHIVVGGSQPPRTLITRYLDELDLRIVQAWGMTETSPLAAVAWPQERMRDWPEDRVTDEARSQAGIPLPGISVTIRDDVGQPVPSDGESMGDLSSVDRGSSTPTPRTRVPRISVTTAGSGPVTWPSRPRRVLRHRRPHEGLDQVGRRVDLFGRDGSGDHGHTLGPRGGGHRGPRPQVAGTSARLRSGPARLLTRAERPAGAPERERLRPVAAAATARAHRRGAQDERGQVRQESFRATFAT